MPHDNVGCKPSFVFNDGGREAAGFKGHAGDCGVRAIAIAIETPYREVYDLVNEYAKRERRTKRRRRQSASRTGVHKATMQKIMFNLGWQWVPTMGIGTGCKVHVRADELPEGRLILNLSKHYAAFIDGVLHDTYDDSRDGTRCVYGYWWKI